MHNAVQCKYDKEGLVVHVEGAIPSRQFMTHTTMLGYVRWMVASVVQLTELYLVCMILVSALLYTLTRHSGAAASSSSFLPSAYTRRYIINCRFSQMKLVTTAVRRTFRDTLCRVIACFPCRSHQRIVTSQDAHTEPNGLAPGGAIEDAERPRRVRREHRLG